MNDAHEPTNTRWSVRLVAFVAILGMLFAGSYVAGVNGLFSSAQRRLNRRLDNPTTRVEATATYAAQIATAIAGSHPIFAGSSDGQTCPGEYEARATSIVEAMDAASASATLGHAAATLADAGWRLDRPTTPASTTSLDAHNRRGLEVRVGQVVGTDASSIVVTVTMPCPSALAPAQLTSASGPGPSPTASSTGAPIPSSLVSGSSGP
jgi:hypothetical protein